MWHSFSDGATLGLKGSESGETIRDEEHTLGARITLEENANIAPFAITRGVYGWMVHTRFFGTEDEAIAEYDRMKSAISEIVKPFMDPSYDDFGAIQAKLESFVKVFP